APTTGTRPPARNEPNDRAELRRESRVFETNPTIAQKGGHIGSRQATPSTAQNEPNSTPEHAGIRRLEARAPAVAEHSRASTAACEDRPLSVSRPGGPPDYGTNPLASCKSKRS